MVESLLSKSQEKTLIALGSFFCDIALSLWIYFRVSNYNAYLKYVKTITDSPDFQVQLYKVYLQSLTFSIMLFLVAHLVVYILYWREMRAAQVYLKFYAAMSSAGCLLLAFFETPFAILPAFLYGAAYFFIAKNIPARTVKARS